MNELNYIIIIISLMILIIVMTVLYIVYLFKYSRLREEHYSFKRSTLKRETRLSMVEYLMRKYKEGNMNIYTLVRDIEDTVHNKDTN